MGIEFRFDSSTPRAWYSLECVEVEFSEVRMQDRAWTARQGREDSFCGLSRGVRGVYMLWCCMFVQEDE